jgi:hypothetical protein
MRSLKVIPCPTCQAPAMWPASAANPQGEPVVTSGYIERFQCDRCKRPVQLRPVDWHRLPYLTVDEVKTLAKRYNAPELEARLTSDWVGNGLSEAQALDMVNVDLITISDVLCLGGANLAHDDEEVASVEYNESAGTTRDSGAGSGP